VHSGEGVATVKDYVDALNAYLLATHAKGQSNVLIIDEAQNLSADVLEQLRLLTNLETNERKLLQIILVGQPELRNLLARPDMEQLAQRVIARYHLEPLSEGETAYYLRHRLAVAGMTGIIPFDREARKRVHELARGVPRRINLLADRALLGAYSKEMPRVNRAIVDQAAREVFDAPSTASTPVVARTWWQPAWMMAAVLAGAGLIGAGWWLRDRTDVTDHGAVRGMESGTPSLADTTKAIEPQPPASASTAASTRRAASTAPSASAPAPVGLAASAAAAASSAPREFAAAPAPMLTAAEVEKFVASLPKDETAAWRHLAALWRVDKVGDAADPCTALASAGVRCYRSTVSALGRIRTLDRPSIVKLHRSGQPVVYAVLTAISDDAVTLRAGDSVRQVPLTSFSSYWKGEIATLWRVPPGGVAAESATLTADTRLWLAARLARLEGRASDAAPLTDDALKARVQAFQRANGLPGGGLAGPLTLMLVNRATGIDEPRLTAGTAPVQVPRPD
jgi:general secretion pathway protein A